MLTAHEFRLRQAQQIQELRHRLQYCTSAEERETILQSLNFWTRFTVPADPEPDTATEKLPVTTNPKGLTSLYGWFTRKLQPALH